MGMRRQNLGAITVLVLFVIVPLIIGGGVVANIGTKDAILVGEALIQAHITLSTYLSDLESSLLMQKITISSYNLDRDPRRLSQLEKQRSHFLSVLKEIRGLKRGGTETFIDEITHLYSAYVLGLDRLAIYYEQGRLEEAKPVFREIEIVMDEITALIRNMRHQALDEAKERLKNTRREAGYLTALSMVALILAGLICIVFLLYLRSHLIRPLEEIMGRLSSSEAEQKGRMSLKSLMDWIEVLMQDIDAAQEKLIKSQEGLLQAEKMALVGRLAAGTAHSIRNPLTSVKMRLYSLSKTLDLNPDQKEDFEVISKEIRHIDQILQNFLEFSRPPKSKFQPLKTSNVVDATLDLLHHKLISHGVNVRVIRNGELPELNIDLEQMKEALANIVMNACEAMGDGGEIVIEEGVNEVDGLGRCGFISVTDTGPGMAPELKSKVFQPFFTTKEEGTGLGLSIANRIVIEHGGKIELETAEGVGSKFVIYIPIRKV